MFSGRFATLALMHEAGWLIETWQLHAVVWTHVYWQLQIAVKCTERTVYSLFSLKHTSNIHHWWQSGGWGSDRWRTDLNSEGIFCVKSLNTHQVTVKREMLLRCVFFLHVILYLFTWLTDDQHRADGVEMLNPVFSLHSSVDVSVCACVCARPSSPNSSSSSLLLLYCLSVCCDLSLLQFPVWTSHLLSPYFSPLPASLLSLHLIRTRVITPFSWSI